jgi:serine/threonine protein phosphatase PrpC
VLLMSDGVSDVLPDDDLLGIGLDALQQVSLRELARAQACGGAPRRRQPLQPLACAHLMTASLCCCCAARAPQAQSSTNDGNALAKAAAAAVMHAAYEAGSGDNITVVAMLLDWGGEFEGGSHA